LRLRHLFLSALALAASACSTPAVLSSSKPWEIPKYPDRPAIQPSVPPSSFNTGPAYDWENASKPPFPSTAADFSNTRSFAETSAWIKKTIDNHVAGRPEGSLSDFHFRGCIVEFHHEWHTGTDHVNEYNHSFYLGDVDVSRGAMQISRDSVRLRWGLEKNRVLSRNWHLDNGKWMLLGERLEQEAGVEFYVGRLDNMPVRLAYAFVHAARLCGAKAPTVR
jgi:hypothetical protein